MFELAQTLKSRVSPATIARLRPVFWGVYSPIASAAFFAAVRVPALFGYRRPAQRLEFGCGPRLSAGYTGVDIRPFPGVRYFCQAWQIDRYVARDSVQAIKSRHFFEHLTFAQAAVTLDAWFAILAPGGVLELEVPDLDYHIAQFQNAGRWNSPSAAGGSTELQHALAGLWGWQTDGMTQTWDVHKAGYNEVSMTKVLAEKRFVGISRVPAEPWNLRMRCEKAHAPR